MGKEAEGTEAIEPHYAGEKEESGRWNSFLEAFGRRTRAWTAIRHALSQYLHVLEGQSSNHTKAGVPPRVLSTNDLPCSVEEDRNMPTLSTY